MIRIPLLEADPIPANIPRWDGDEKGTGARTTRKQGPCNSQASKVPHPQGGVSLPEVTQHHNGGCVVFRNGSYESLVLVFRDPALPIAFRILDAAGPPGALTFCPKGSSLVEENLRATDPRERHPGAWIPVMEDVSRLENPSITIRQRDPLPADKDPVPGGDRSGGNLVDISFFCDQVGLVWDYFDQRGDRAPRFLDSAFLQDLTCLKNSITATASGNSPIDIAPIVAADIRRYSLKILPGICSSGPFRARSSPVRGRRQ